MSLLHQSCGVMTACLTDPLSLFINKILGHPSDSINAVGLYYQDQNRTQIVLYNTYNTEHISWFRPGGTLENLLYSPFVRHLTYYPLTSNQGSLHSRSSVHIKPAPQIELKFQAAAAALVAHDIPVTDDPEKNLWLKVAGIYTGTGDEHTGYSLVNKVLVQCLRGKSVVISDRLIHCPILGVARTMVSSQVPSSADINCIVQESGEKIRQLNSAFVQLFTTNDDFRTAILQLSSTDNNLSSLDDLFSKEMDLMNHLIGSLASGTLSNKSLNDIIVDMNRIRHRNGNHVKLPISVSPQKIVHITDDDVVVTYQHEQISDSTDPLEDLGNYIAQLAENFTNQTPITVNLGTLISCYNRIIDGTGLDLVPVPNLHKLHTVSRGAVVTFPGSGDYEINHPGTGIVSMYDPNLNNLTNGQLLDILTYIDSLRDTDGTYDTRFTNLQNEIIRELAHRS